MREHQKNVHWFTVWDIELEYALNFTCQETIYR